MKTIYLKNIDNELLMADIAKVIEDYNGAVESQNLDGTIFCHYIGKIMLSEPIIDENFNVITPEVLTDEFYCNILALDDEFDESIFETLTVIPNNPKHQFA